MKLTGVPGETERLSGESDRCTRFSCQMCQVKLTDVPGESDSCIKVKQTGVPGGIDRLPSETDRLPDNEPARCT